MDRLAAYATTTATAADLALMYGVPIGTIYRWASEDQWRRSNPKRRPVVYNRADADKTYQDRHGPAGPA